MALQANLACTRNGLRLQLRQRDIAFVRLVHPLGLERRVWGDGAQHEPAANVALCQRGSEVVRHFHETEQLLGEHVRTLLAHL